MADPSELLDRCWSLYVELDDQMPLWEADVTQIERWPAMTVEETGDARRRLLAMRDEALAAISTAGALAPSLRTAADALALRAAEADVTAERTWANPRVGLVGYLHWAVNDFVLTTADHGQQYLAKLAGFPAAIDGLRERLVLAADDGRPLLARHATDAASAIEAQLEAGVDDDPLLAQAAPTDLDDGAAEWWRHDLRDAVATHVHPALGRLRDTLRQVAARGRADDACGLVAEPGGAAAYAELVEGFTAPGVTPQQVHDTGLAQLERLKASFEELGARVLDTSDHAEIIDRLRSDPALRHDAVDTLLADAEAMFARAVEVAPSWFRRTPQAGCELRATEHGSLAFYSPPPPDGARGGITYFNVSDPGSWGPDLAATVFHEAIPGHHFQAALAVEDTALHDLHRRLFLPAYGEGWALYAEQLAEEMDLYTSDVERLGMLSTDAMRACRLVVDTGMHALGWSRQQAIDTMRANTPLVESAIVAEVDRYIGMPGQAVSYMMGRLWIEELRRNAEQRLGDAFDVRDFHDVVLGHGMVSLPALRDLVTAWLDDAR